MHNRIPLQFEWRNICLFPNLYIRSIVIVLLRLQMCIVYVYCIPKLVIDRSLIIIIINRNVFYELPFFLLVRQIVSATIAHATECDRQIRRIAFCSHAMIIDLTKEIENWMFVKLWHTHELDIPCVCKKKKKTRHGYFFFMRVSLMRRNGYRQWSSFDHFKIRKYFYANDFQCACHLASFKNNWKKKCYGVYLVPYMNTCSRTMRRFVHRPKQMKRK